jgi:hypothetical protein
MTCSAVEVSEAGSIRAICLGRPDVLPLAERFGANEARGLGSSAVSSNLTDSTKRALRSAQGSQLGRRGRCAQSASGSETKQRLSTRNLLPNASRPRILQKFRERRAAEFLGR